MIVWAEITSDHFVIGSMRHPRGTRMTFPLQVAKRLEFEQKVKILDNATAEVSQRDVEAEVSPDEQPVERRVRKKRTYRRRDMSAQDSNE